MGGSFPISEQIYTLGKLLDGTECQILLDIGASKSFMSKSYYMCCKSPHSLANLHQRHREFRYEMVSLLVYYL